MARAFQRLAGSDPLYLREGDKPSYWLACDASARKVRYVHTMFATESKALANRRGLALAAALASLVIGAEIVLRILGFGTPVLYLNDLDVGYYPAPNQQVHRYGGDIRTNEWSMRAPAFSKEKPEGAFRVLMLGDSTLWGGSDIDQTELYARLLESQLDTRFAADAPIEVLNMGVNGWGPLHELGYVKKFGTFDADLAVICMPYGDVYRTLLTPLSMQPYFSASAPPRLGLEEIAGHLMWRYRWCGINAPAQEDLDRQAVRALPCTSSWPNTCRRPGAR